MLIDPSPRSDRAPTSAIGRVVLFSNGERRLTGDATNGDALAVVTSQLIFSSSFATLSVQYQADYPASLATRRCNYTLLFAAPAAVFSVMVR